MKLLIVIPALNEERTIGRVVSNGREYITDHLVIDDGSTDRTAAIAAAAGAEVVSLPHRGKGAALRTGFAAAIERGCDWVFTLDADGQHDPADIPKFLPYLEDADLVLGNRMTASDRIPALRRLANQTSSTIVSAVAGTRIEDSQTGFRAYRVEMLRHIECVSDRYELESEIIIRAVRRGYRIAHCPIRTIYAGEVSRYLEVQDSVRFLRLILKSFAWK